MTIADLTLTFLVGLPLVLSCGGESSATVGTTADPGHLAGGAAGSGTDATMPEESAAAAGSGGSDTSVDGSVGGSGGAATGSGGAAGTSGAAGGRDASAGSGGTGPGDSGKGTSCRSHDDCAEGYLCVINHYIPTKASTVCQGEGICVEAPAACAKPTCECGGSILCGALRCLDFSPSCFACMDR